MKRIELRMKGRVQGVYFRQSTLEKAEALGVVGWVRNCEDGDVEATAEGSEEALEKFVAWCHKGPASAKVTDVQVTEWPATGEFTTFRIER